MTKPTEVSANRFVVTGIDRLLTVQRPAVLAHLHSIRSKHPDATPEEIIRILERRYLAAVTTGGVVVGASAVVPGIGMGAALALSTVETGGFLEASALFAQSVTEVHGIVVDDPDRARTLVMTLILGTAGSDLVKQLASQAAGTGPEKSRFWGELVTKNLPKAAMGQVADRLKKTFVKRFAVTQGTNVIGRAIPFGIGAVVGGTGNNLLGRQVIRSSREAFRMPPQEFPASLELRVKAPKTITLPRAPKGERTSGVARIQRALGRGRAAGQSTETPAEAPAAASVDDLAGD
ncbi:MAG: hypothetical protein JWM51_839 [Microbacteriaceae bacterium]|nr:hypothetical protein [Microbacteriaceae bacterium]